MDLVLLIFFSCFNIVGLFLWAYIFMITMNVVVCRELRDYRFKISLFNIFDRKTCIAIRRFYKRFQTLINNTRYFACVLTLIGSGFAIMHRLTELSYHVTTNLELYRCIAAVFIPLGIMYFCKALGCRVAYI
jgi:hypothetical protein